jgi:transaldolase
MKATHELHDLGQSLWLDNITRGLLTSGTLRRYISELSMTRLSTKVGCSKLREEMGQ